MQAIQTQYRGFRFRSRLEARWAVFLDQLGVTWTYEPEGFLLSDGRRYLPDFWIPCPEYHGAGAGYWLEVKGPSPSEEDLAKCKRLAQDSGHIAILVYGDINGQAFGQYSFDPVREAGVVTGVRLQHSNERSKEMQAFLHALQYDPAEQPFWSHFSIASRFWSGQQRGHLPEARFAQAIEAARRARFEHGESGA